MKRSADNLSDPTKRQKLGDPSKVLHVRGLPSYTTESELVSVVAPFGQVVKCLILPSKNQGFIQMASVNAATELLNSLEFTQPQIRSKAIYFDYSSRQEVETKNNNPVAGGGDATSEGASCTLLISVLNVTVPVTLDNICQICKPYGEVLKIITFPKGNDFQALIQLATVEQAVNAKLFLDGKDLFQGCCHLRVNFSKRANLVVKENSHKSRDYTQSMLPGQDFASGQGGIMGNAANAYGGGQPMNQLGQQPMNMGGSTVVLVSKMNAETTTPDSLFMLFGAYGDVLKVKILYNKRDTAMIQFATPQQANYACQHLSGAPFLGAVISVNSSKHTQIQMPKLQDEDSQLLTKDFTGHPAHRFKNKMHTNPKNVNAPSQVLHVSNLYDGATEQELRDLFASQQPQATSAPVVEFFKNNRKMAYIAMASLEDAVNALVGLHSSPLGSYPLRVSFSHKEAAKVTNSDQ